jgi:hypothetical protein
MKLDALNLAIANTPSQFNSGASGIQLAPGEYLPFVKNYLHLKPAPLPQFPAQQLAGYRSNRQRINSEGL